MQDHFHGLGMIRRLREVVRFPADFASEDAEVNAVAFGLESTCVLTGGSDGVLRVWRVPGDISRSSPPTLLLGCSGHSGAIQSIAVDTTNGLAVTGSADGTARVWYLPVLMGASESDLSAFSWELPPVAPLHITKPAAPRGGRRQRHTSPGAFKYAQVAFSGSTLVTLEASEFVSAALLQLDRPRGSSSMFLCREGLTWPFGSWKKLKQQVLLKFQLLRSKSWI